MTVIANPSPGPVGQGLGSGDGKAFNGWRSSTSQETPLIEVSPLVFVSESLEDRVRPGDGVRVRVRVDHLLFVVGPPAQE